MLQHVFTNGMLLASAAPLRTHASTVTTDAAPTIRGGTVDISGGCGPTICHRTCPFGFSRGLGGHRCTN